MTASRKLAGVRVETGVFQADMAVTLVNNGPVTLIVESPIGLRIFPVETLDDFGHVALACDSPMFEKDRTGSKRTREVGVMGHNDFCLRQTPQERQKIAARGRDREM